MTTPAEQGFHMPFEGDRHERCWMGWPCRAEIWNGRDAEAKRAYAAVAQAIARFEPVIMLANEGDLAEARALCGDGVEIMAMPLDDSWLRDSGPTFLKDGAGRIGGAAWRFNAWGDKFETYERDAQVSRAILRHQDVPAFAAPFVLEGGSIHVDGEGTVLTSEQCLLNPNRNPSLSRDEIEANLRAWLGVSTIVWLGQGLENDGTDGHVDNLACFVKPGVVLAASAADPADANFAPLADNLRRLKAARDAQGRAFEVIELPIPAARACAAGRMALNYVNFYLANGAVIAPAFDDPMDRVAFETLTRVFPERKIVPVPALGVLEGGGGIHCITQQQPARA